MLTRGISAPARCNIIPTKSIGRCPLDKQIRYSRRTPWFRCTLPVNSSTHIVRGAKSKTVVKVRDLPQGNLPPLPRDAEDDVSPTIYTQTLQQHRDHMDKYNDCVLFTRIGDFFEMYFEHVELYAPLLGLKQARKRSNRGFIPMAGFQHWQLDKYAKILIKDHGLNVAIAEQIDVFEADGSKSFDRQVRRILTPGTLVDEGYVDSFESNYLLALHIDGVDSGVSTDDWSDRASDLFKRTTKVGLSWVDLSSGEFLVQTSDLATLPSLVTRIGPKEVVLPSFMHLLDQVALQRILGEGGWPVQFHEVSEPLSSVAAWTPMLEREIVEKERAMFSSQEIAAGNIALDYVRDKLRDTNLRLQPPTRRSDNDFMAIDRQSLRGLEIRKLIRDGSTKGSLLHAIRRTVTEAGARLLSQRIVSPSMALPVINNRLDLVDEMLSDDALREDVSALLLRTSDTRRLVQKFTINRGDADDLLGLARTIDIMGQMAEILHEHILAEQGVEDSKRTDCASLWDMLGRLDLDEPNKLAKKILATIDEEGLTQQHTIEDEVRRNAEAMTEEVIEADEAGEKPPQLARRAARSKSGPSADSSEVSSEDTWIMRRNASATLQSAHRDLENLLESKQKLTLELMDRLKVKNIALQWTPKNAHHCHLKRKDIKPGFVVPDDMRTIQSNKTTLTLSSAEWDVLGKNIDEAKLRIRQEEERVLQTLRAQVIENIPRLRRNAAVLEELDVSCSSAIVAKERGFVRPILDNSTSHDIIGGRHPTVDIGLNERGRPFTSNDCAVGGQGRIYLITGPNMAGKSTYLRQNALITILAQMGCFVPADYARIGLVDKIFSRVGSADNLYQDQSTFMVEMLETAEILKRATPRSFVIMDEVGRGTTPEDGVAVSYSCLHHIHHVNKCRTLFATHFHVLAEMTKEFNHLACYCTDIQEESDGSWVYVHKLRKGVNRHSHALKVARLAGLPEEAIAVADAVLKSSGPSLQSEETPVQSSGTAMAGSG